MGVTVVYGRSGSGKSRYLMNHIKTQIADPFARVLVIVPGQLTFETEKRIMHACGTDGIFGLQVMSVQRLAAKWWRYRGGELHHVGGARDDRLACAFDEGSSVPRGGCAAGV